MHELLCAAKSAKIAMHLYLLVYHIIIKLQLLVDDDDDGDGETDGEEVRGEQRGKYPAS